MNRWGKITKTNLMPWMSLDLWELELGVMRIHALDFLTCWCSQDLKSEKTDC